MATSALNPNAPVFIPSSYRTVEDFSDQWWDLVKSSPYFRDYWLQECFADVPAVYDVDDLDRYEIVDEFDLTGATDGVGGKKSVGDGTNMDLVGLGWLKWRKPPGSSEMPRYCEKPPKIVNVRVSPRQIQQPR